MERLTLDDAADATGGTLTRPAARRVAVSGVTLDSRTARPGDLFWAVRGERFDGHDFVAAAARSGAVAAVVERDLPGAPVPLLVVPDVVAALGRFAGWYRRLQDALVVAVTGSVGKTTTRELIYHALGGEPHAVRSRKNHNNHLGLPLSLLDIETRHRFAVAEIGASRIGEVAGLAHLARPEVGVVTYFGVAHAETFGGREGIVAGKGELLEAVPPAGFAVLPGDQDVSRHAAKRCRGRTVTVGLGPASDVRAEVLPSMPGRLRVRIDGATFDLAANGRHFATAAATAVTVARRLGRSDADIAAGLLDFEPVAGRCRVVCTAPWTVIDDTYNANPDSMRAALDTLADWPAVRRRVFVCGDMYGLGDAADAAHVELGRQAAARGVDLVAAIGAYAGRVAHGARRGGMDARRLALFATRDDAAAWLRGTLTAGDAVLVKASRPLGLEHLVEAIRGDRTADERRAA